MERILDDRTTGQVQKALEQLKEPVQVLFFGSEENCTYCGETRQLLEEVTALNDKLSLKTYDLKKDAEFAAKYNVDKTPAILVAAKNGNDVVDLGVQFSGIPSGYEFSTFINDILLVSGRDSGLKEQTRAFLKSLKTPLHLQVFVTPT